MYYIKISAIDGDFCLDCRFLFSSWSSYLNFKWHVFTYIPPIHLGWLLNLHSKKCPTLPPPPSPPLLPRTSAPSRPLYRPRAAPTLLPVRATNPLRPRFTLSPYLIPLNPQLPPWLLTEHDRLWTALVINNSPALRSASSAAAAGHRFVLSGACRRPRCALTSRILFT